MQKNDYIIQRSGGGLWHFFHSDAEGLCLRKKEDNRWGDHEILLDNAFFDFCVLCDGNDNMHMVCQDMEGSILYLCFHHGQWHKYTLLQSKTKNAYAKHFKLLLTGTQLQLYYTIRSGGKLLLVHQLPGSDYEPAVVDVVRDSLRPFSAVCDDYQNTYLYYQNAEGMLGGRTYQWSRKEFDEFASTGEGGAESPFVYLDPFGRQHVCAIQQAGLLYLQRGVDGQYDKKSHIATGSDAPMYLPILLGDENKLWLLWRQGIAVYYARSSDDAESWSNPTRFVSTGAAPQLFVFQRGEDVAYCWGYLSGGEIHLFATGKAERQSAPVRASAPRQGQSQQKKEGQDAEEFADRHAGEFGENAAAARMAGSVQPVRPARPQPQPSASEVDLAKMKILISALGEQVSKQKKSIAQLTEKVQQMEARLQDR